MGWFGEVLKQCPGFVPFLTHVGPLYNPRFADVLLDYGSYLLKDNRPTEASDIFEMSLHIRSHIFGGNSIHVAIAAMHMSRALFATNTFTQDALQKAKGYADQALGICDKILPSDHLLWASSKTIKAWIMESIASFSSNPRLLLEAEDLLRQSLSFTLCKFGDIHIGTAEAYENLGLLHKAMRGFHEAETMVLKAIEIKEKVLGLEDIAVARSVAYLAGIYSCFKNYGEDRHAEAKTLYLRAIAICKNLFGENYSVHSELDVYYIGLAKIHQEMGEAEERDSLKEILDEWNMAIHGEFDDEGPEQPAWRNLCIVCHLACKIGECKNKADPEVSWLISIDQLKKEFFDTACTFPLSDKVVDAFKADIRRNSSGDRYPEATTKNGNILSLS
jgi:tetratricopeptide (TPR) repeat protein